MIRGTMLLALLFSAMAGVVVAGWRPVQERSVFVAETTARIIDVVVRDNKGKPVIGLDKSDFQLTEDGVAQDVLDIATIDPGGRRPSAAKSSAELRATGVSSPPVQSADSAGPTDPTARSTTAILFERLSPESRGPARAAALRMLKDEGGPGEFEGVFLLDLSLRIVEPFTTDRIRQRAAVDQASRSATSYYEPNRIGISMKADASADIANSGVDAFRELTQLQQGHTSLNALQALVTALGVLPGRKSIIYFSDGLPLASDGAQARFHALIGQANRSNVAIYPVDAVGLRVHSQDAANGQALREAALQDMVSSSAQGNDLAGGTGAVMGESVLRSGTTSQVFRRLAADTGGIVVENTNGLDGGLTAINSDRRFYYLLTYTPKNNALDGKWRTVKVTVSRQHITVRARSGYIAAPARARVMARPVEGAALEALERNPAPTEVPIRARALVFPGSSQSRIAVLAAVDGGALLFHPDPTASIYRTDFTIAARIVDAAGAAVRRSSQTYPLSGPLAQLQQAQSGEVLFFRQPELGPGGYTLEVAVHDALAMRSGVSRFRFVVPESNSDAVQISSLVLVARVEPVAPGTGDKSNPLFVGDLLLYPNLGEPLRKSKEKTLMFYVALKAAPGPSFETTVEILRDDETVATGPVVLDPELSKGSSHISKVPIDTLLPGQYTLRLTVTQNGRRESRDAKFQVAQ